MIHLNQRFGYDYMIVGMLAQNPNQNTCEVKLLMALRIYPVRNNPVRNNPETRNNPEHTHKSPLVIILKPYVIIPYVTIPPTS